MDSETLTVFLGNVWDTTVALSFWLLVGALVAGLLRVFVPDDFIERHLGNKRGLSGVLKAVLLGVPMPLCSCGVIPAALGIKKQGAGDGAAMGFLISTPQTGVDSIMVSASLLGFPFAVFKLLSAFVIGIVGGVWTAFSGGGENHAETAPAEPASAEAASSKQTKKGLKDALEFAVDDLLKMIWKWLVAGILVSAAITTWLPADFFKDYLPEGEVLLPMLLVLLVSLPMYVCATASVPVAAALVHSGMPVGAALVFLMAGPASNVATIGAVYKTFGFKKLLIYLTVIILGSLAGGYFFDTIVTASIPDVAASHSGVGGIAKTAAAALLVALIARFAWMDAIAWGRGLRAKRRLANDAEKLDTLTLTVVGMTCSGCAAHLCDALRKVEGVVSVETDFETGNTIITGEALERELLEKTVAIAGYAVAK